MRRCEVFLIQKGQQARVYSAEHGFYSGYRCSKCAVLGNLACHVEHSR